SVANTASDPQDYSTSLKGIRILLAEDNYLNQVLAKAVLNKVNCTVDVAENGKTAIEKLKANPYDVVLMDIQMPEMDGYEATKYIRTRLERPLSEIPIIAMTAHALHTEVDKCLMIGMNDYISKPFKTGDLYSKIYKHVVENKSALAPDRGGEENGNPASPNETGTFSDSILNFDVLRDYTAGDNGFMVEIVSDFLHEMPRYEEQMLNL